MSAHPVFVLDPHGNPLTPTTPAKARKLLQGGVAEKVWSKFGTFGIRMLVETRHETPRVALGVDHGTKFEGYSVVVDRENALNVKLDLPDKKEILKKVEERRTLRRARRFRKCRRRPCRSDNRSRKDFLAPSQKVLVDSRLKVLDALCRTYPINVAGVEDVCFNHATKRWGAQHGGGRQAGGERVCQASDADHPGGGDRPVRVRGLRRCVRPTGSIPGRRVQPEADPLVAGLPDPGRVRAAMAQGPESHGPAMTKGRNQRPSVFVHSVVRSAESCIRKAV